MKQKLFAFVLIVTLLLCSVPVCALQNPFPPDTSNLGKNTIYFVEEPWGITATIPIFHISEIAGNVLPKTVKGGLNSVDYVDCSVAWEKIAPSTGRQFVTGIISAPEGYVLSPKASKISLLILVYDDQPVATINELHLDDTIEIMPKGGNVADIQIYERAEGYTEDGDDIMIPAIYDLSLINPNIVGKYQIPCSPVLPKGVAISENVKFKKKFVYVVDPDELSLGAVYDAGSSICCRWLKSIDVNEATLERAVGDGDWQTIDSNDIEIYFLTNTFLYLHKSEFVIGVDYYFRLLYQGEYTETLHIRLSENEKEHLFEYGGNRDGSDQIEPPFPPLTQPAPEEPNKADPVVPKSPDNSKEFGEPDLEYSAKPDSAKKYGAPDSYETIEDIGIASMTTPSNSNVQIMEEITENSTKISGTRLRMMTESYPDFIPFEHNGIMICFETLFIKSLDLRAEDIFFLSIEKLNVYSFKLSVSINGAELRGYQSFIRMPYDGNPEENLILKKDDQLTDVIVSVKNNLAEFSVDTAGIYTIVYKNNLQASIKEVDRTASYTENIFKFIVIGVAISFVLIVTILLILFPKRGARFGK